ncbi:MAG TPA: metallopeptidase family protein [Nitrospiraceae bacterium]|nr:metallopeptidase family protein [Nitrospiraceae bacterium]
MPRRRARSLSISPEDFEDLVHRAIDGLPDEYRRLLKNVAVVVEEEPSREVLDELEIESEDDLLGLYSGTALDAESFFDAGGHLPARISIYRGPILRLCRTSDEVIQEVRDTVVHEIGHHFGLDDEEMPY